MGLFATPGFKVGIMVVGAVLIIGGMALKVSDGSVFSGAKKYFFRIKTATGLVPKSAVKMAGIKVGLIDRITLEDGKARLDLLIDQDVPVYKDAKIVVRMTGILGDKFVDLQQGNPASGELAEEQEIGRVEVFGTVENVVEEISQLSASLKEVSQSILSATEGSGDRDRPIAKIVDNLEKVSRHFAEMTEENRDSLEQIVDDIRSVTGTLRQTVEKENMEKIDRAIANIEAVTEKVAKGEGTLGKLVNDEKTVNGINTAIDGVNRFLDVANRIQTSVALRAEYLNRSALNRTYFGVRITPGLDRYYDIAVVDDPMGVQERVDTSTSTGGITTEVSETKVWKNKVKFTALMAKNFYDFTVRGGIIESSGGLGLDYHLFRKRLTASVEAFDFQPGNVRWRGSVKYFPYRGFSVVVGADDWTSASRPFSSYLGAGLEFTNDDFKMVLAR